MAGLQGYDSGCLLFAAGRFLEATAVFKGCLEKYPDQPDLLNALGSSLAASGELEEAQLYHHKACLLQPDRDVFHYNYANLLRRLGLTDGAESEYLEAIRCNPQLAEAFHGLGSLYMEAGRLEPAESCLIKALSLKPGSAAAQHDLGQLFQSGGRIAEAEECFRRSIAADKLFLPALNSLGMLLLRSNRIEEARNCFVAALALNPGYLQARANLAVLATWTGELDFAVDELRSVLAMAPADGDVHFNLSLALLTSGQMAEGWQEHEWRFRKARAVEARHAGIPRWQGERLAGKRILVHSEQGYGDSLQFIRYAPLLAQQGGLVFVEGQDSRITPLLAMVAGVAAAFPRGEAVPEVDFQIPMMSLPLAIGNSAWPPPVGPYLDPPADKRLFWGKKLERLAGMKVGLAWAGRPEHENDANRSIPAEMLADFGRIPGISFVSLQIGCGNVRDVPFELLDPSSDVADFTDSAALVSQLDLVITIDSAVAHLAGGIGVPVWLLLPWNPDWRWMRDRRDSPWYPGMTVFRQSTPGSWGEVIGEAVSRLKTDTCYGLREAGSATSCGKKHCGGEMQAFSRNYGRLDNFLNRLASDVYPEKPSLTHADITSKALNLLDENFPLAPGMRVLDVGCGQGPALEFFRSRQMDYLGITLGDEDLAICRSKGYRVEKMDQSFLDFPDSSFELLWARHVIEHSIFPYYTLSEFSRVLSFGGILYLEAPAPETPCHHEQNPNHYSVLSKGCWKTLLERCGFRIIGDVDYNFEVPVGPDLYWGFFCLKVEEHMQTLEKGACDTKPDRVPGYGEVCGGDKKLWAEDLAKPGRDQVHSGWFRTDTIDYWRHERMYEAVFKCLQGSRHDSWLTVGDGRYGLDAIRMMRQGFTNVTATDIEDTLLRISLESGLLEKIGVENAERLSFADKAFDYVLCKESFHHFPRPMLALYEMIRVAKKGVVLVEPQDPYIDLPVLGGIHQEFFEEEGNYIYSLSRRELEKVVLGLKLPAVGFKNICDSFVTGMENELAVDSNPQFVDFVNSVRSLEQRCARGEDKYNMLLAVVFIEKPDQQSEKLFYENGWTLTVY
jgi:Flp pilus assembly protein TadD/ubiquinone/menaquinone biosynthesis C-methylase UbiE